MFLAGRRSTRVIRKCCESQWRIPRSSGSFEPVIVVQATKNWRRDDAPSERNVVTVTP